MTSPGSAREIARLFHRPAAVAAVAVGAALCLAGPAEAQPGERLQIAVSALEHVRESLPAGRAALDPRLFCEARIFGWSCPDELTRAVRALELDLGSREFSYVCIGGERGCRLIGTDVLIELLEPVVRGRRATIRVDTWWRTRDRAHPVGRRRTVLQLQREGRSWRVVEEDLRVPGGED